MKLEPNKKRTAGFETWKVRLQWLVGWWQETIWVRWVIGAAFLALAAWWSWHEFHSISWRTVSHNLHEARAIWIAIAVLSTVLVSSSMGYYAAYAFPEGRNKLSFVSRWWIGFIIAGIANVFALGGIGSTSIRFFVYTRKGLSNGEVAAGVARLGITSVSAMTGWIVACALPLPFSGFVEVVVRGLILLPVAFSTLWLSLGRVEKTLNSLHKSPLHPPSELPLLAGAVIEWGASAFTLYALIRAVGIEVSMDDSFRTYFVGIVTGLISMLPGGVGSADTMWLSMLRHFGSTPDQAAAATLLFRVIAYLGPLGVSLVASLFLFRKHSIDRLLWQRRILAFSTGLGAVIFLISAATPSLPERLAWLQRFTPVGVVELSHVAAVLSGAMLLFLTRGIWRGYQSAFVLVGTLLATSLVAQLLKGIDYEEAIVSGLLLLFLISARPAFTRKGGLDLNIELSIAIGLAVVFFYLFAGFTAFERIPYRPDLWIQFAHDAEASRFLRAGVALALLVGVLIVRRAVRPTSRRVFADKEEIGRAETLIRQWGESADGLLVGGGDKAVWFWGDRGLVVYQHEGSRMVCLKDPLIAPGTDRHELMRALLEEANRQDRIIVFSMIGADWWETLHEFGFRMLKLTEEALVDLPEFSLEGSSRKGLRQSLRNVEKEGITFSVLEPPYRSEIIDACRRVSDAWLASKGGHELQFSACYFSESYLQRHPLGVARAADGEIIAFVNLLCTRPGGPSTLDFMRYIPRRVDDLMEYVITRAILAAKERGASFFSLGGAAMRAVGEERTAHHIERLLRGLSRRAERIYNYGGLERYKSKFHPRWEPRYLAYQNPLDWASALIANGRLVQARRRSDRLRIAAARIASGIVQPEAVDNVNDFSERQ